MADLICMVAGELSGDNLAAALILPLYYLADATITVSHRLARGEPVWQAHRTHFYQRATDNGFAVPAIVGRVLAINLVLAVLALVSVAANSPLVSGAALLLGCAAVWWLLVRFARPMR